jgi:hypothetical protein
MQLPVARPEGHVSAYGTIEVISFEPGPGQEQALGLR